MRGQALSKFYREKPLDLNDKGETKVCSTCKKEKPVSEFYKSDSFRGSSKYKAKCKECSKPKKK